MMDKEIEIDVESGDRVEVSWVRECRNCVTHYLQRNKQLRTAYELMNIPSIGLAAYISYTGIAEKDVNVQVTSILLLGLLLVQKGLKLSEWSEVCSMISKGYASIVREYDTVVENSSENEDNVKEVVSRLKNRYIALEAQERILPIEASGTPGDKTTLRDDQIRKIERRILDQISASSNTVRHSSIGRWFRRGKCYQDGDEPEESSREQETREERRERRRERRKEKRGESSN